MSGGIELLGELREPGGPNALSLAGGQVATRFTLCRGARNSVTSHPTHTSWHPMGATERDLGCSPLCGEDSSSFLAGQGAGEMKAKMRNSLSISLNEHCTYPATSSTDRFLRHIVE